eukprot:TRINITY_DN7524_c0_g1_i2.p1 TRINITY_DN7524_c0_g1~~TRINITY_DN7524_c0_g1_i2.p1  ORF type:complete len:201 (-),score=30.46 TRINITY_DN7524_c0_g1_i2:122-679(-)
MRCVHEVHLKIFVAQVQWARSNTHPDVSEDDALAKAKHLHTIVEQQVHDDHDTSLVPEEQMPPWHVLEHECGDVTASRKTVKPCFWILDGREPGEGKQDLDGNRWQNDVGDAVLPVPHAPAFERVGHARPSRCFQHKSDGNQEDLKLDGNRWQDHVGDAVPLASHAPAFERVDHARPSRCLQHRS